NGQDWQITGWNKNQWRLNNSLELGEKIAAQVSTFSGEVPGAVQLDLLNEGLIPDPNYGLKSRDCEWVNNREWFYEKEFTLPQNFRAEKYELCFEGLDSQGEIHFNGQKIADFSGTFIPVKVDITGEINLEESNHLRVIFYQNPEVDGQIGYTDQIDFLKPRFNYGWDWIPRIVPVGIWDDVYIKAYNNLQIKDFNPQTSLQQKKKAGTINIKNDLEVEKQQDYIFRYTVYDNQGNKVKTKKETSFLRAANQVYESEIKLEDIELWWPHGYGKQPLYEIKVTIFYEKEGQKNVCDSWSKKVGFREVEFKQNHNSPQKARPYTLYINGQRIFMKGVNWVPISPFYGGVNREDYYNYLQRFKEMNCNILRVWGGAILEKEDFYELCDELGLLVWQEFPQSSSGLNNTPPAGEDYLEELQKVAEVFIKKRRHHVSLIIWCGGNELTWEDGTPVDERHKNINLLKKIVESRDPDKHFLPTSPSGPSFANDKQHLGEGVHHDVHGPWKYQGTPEHYHFYNHDDALIRTENGCPGISRLSTLQKYQKDYQLWPPNRSNPYWEHRGAWWVQQDELTSLFGEWEQTGNEIKSYIKASRFIQAEALRYALEGTRRREPQSSGFLIWMGNEPYPNNANTSVLEYDGTPKPAYYWVKEAFSAHHVSAKYNRISYVSGEEFKADIFVNSDFQKEKKYKIRARLVDIKGRIIKDQQWEITTSSLGDRVGDLHWQTEELEQNIFFLRLNLVLEKQEVSKNTYIFTLDSRHPFYPLKKLLASEIDFEQKGSEIKLVNNSATVKPCIFLAGEKINSPKPFLNFNKGYFILFPGETEKIKVESLAEM
ncbi:MAG: glycoside hydrolase family 2 protein, partial [Halanaerobiaceae bacterium]